MFYLYRLFVCFYLLLSTALTDHPSEKPLVIYIHETLYNVQKEQLKSLCDFAIVLKSFSGADLLAKVLLEGEKSKADVIVGLEGEQAFTQRVGELAAPLSTELYDVLSLPFDWDNDRFLPISYGYLAFLYDSRLVDPDLRSLTAFLTSLPPKSIVISDPRTSMVGRGGVSWVESQDYGLLHQKVRTYPKGWSGAFALFQTGKVPVMLGYNTSLFLHHQKGQNFIKIALFKETPHPLQVITAFLIKKQKKHSNALSFLKVLLSPDMQTMAFDHYQYAVTDIKVPVDYEALRPDTVFILKAFSPDRLKDWMKAGYR